MLTPSKPSNVRSDYRAQLMSGVADGIPAAHLRQGSGYCRGRLDGVHFGAKARSGPQPTRARQKKMAGGIWISGVFTVFCGSDQHAGALTLSLKHQYGTRCPCQIGPDPSQGPALLVSVAAAEIAASRCDLPLRPEPRIRRRFTTHPQCSMFDIALKVMWPFFGWRVANQCHEHRALLGALSIWRSSAPHRHALVITGTGDFLGRGRPAAFVEAGVVCSQIPAA